MSVSAHFLLRLTGLVMCLVSGATLLVAFWLTATAAPGDAFPGTLLVRFFGPVTDVTLRVAVNVWTAICAVSIGIFAWTFAWTCHWTTLPRRRPPPLIVIALVAQMLLGILVDNDLLILTSMELPMVFGVQVAVIWLGLQELASVGLSLLLLMTQGGAMTVQVGAHNVHYSWLAIASIRLLEIVTAAGWHGFAFCAGFLITSEGRGRLRLAEAHAELLATQELLVEGVRAAERLRIARDLHDSIGHHLMALSLHLEIAARAVVADGKEAVAVARELTRSLTTEVREAVGSARGEQAVDLERALAALCAGIPEPRIELCYDKTVVLSDMPLANLIFRCVQEAVSNAVRHADARKITVRVLPGSPGIRIFIEDDGQGGSGLECGHGLNGMNERVTGRGGRLELETSQGDGLALRIWLPLANGADA